MNPLVSLVKEFQRAKKVEIRLRLADDIICSVGVKLDRYIFHRLRVNLIQDAQQETLIGIAKGLATFKGATDKEFWGWCYRIARNKMVNALRGETARPIESLNEEEVWRALEASGADEPISAGERQDLEYAMRLLSNAKPPCFHYLRSHFLIGLSYGEFKGEYGMNEDAARMAIKRCLELVRELIA